LHRLTTLPSGVRVVTESMDSVRSVALGFWIGTGSVTEDEPEAGLSHLLEHMLFRGTDRYESLEIDQLFDAMGAELNAGTGKETTSVYARVLDVHLPEAFDVMHEMVWKPRIAAEDLDNERQIVLEEIAMYEDDPQDKVFDVLGQAIFGVHPLGRAVIGYADVVAGSRADVLKAFHAQRYGPHNVVLAAAGSIDHDALVELALAADAAALPASTAPLAPPPPEGLEARMRFIRKDTEQYHVCLGAPGIARDDDRRWALRVLDNVLGGTSSSRLFQEVRERRGLAYSVFSFGSHHHDAGVVGVSVGCLPHRVDDVLSTVRAELAAVAADGITDEELERGKGQLRGGLVLGLEDSGSRMSRLGKAELIYDELLPVDEVIARIDAVTRDDVRTVARTLFTQPEILAVVGPQDPAS
jgi:predicted Zn-dependent peptidase